jgi:hypothetical protein
VYFGKLKERFGDVGIFCLSLLKGEGEEANVLHAFHDAAARERVNVINFDWHDQVLAASFCCGFAALFFADSLQIKSLGQHTAVQRLWEIVGPLLRDHGFNSGVGASTNVPNAPKDEFPSSPARERRTSSASAVVVDYPPSSGIPLTTF